jgi:hypothetical protein
MYELQPEALIDLWYGPGPMRDVVENWQEVTWAGVATLRREAARIADPRLDELVKRAEGAPEDHPTARGWFGP